MSSLDQHPERLSRRSLLTGVGGVSLAATLVAPPSAFAKGPPQTSQAAPALAFFNGQIWAAFVANNSGREVLVCSSSDGVNWSGNIGIRQSSQFAPSLAAFNNELWVAFVANNSGRAVLVCSSSDGTSWSGNSVNIRQTTQAAPALAVISDLNVLCVAFIANNSSRDLLACVSSDGVNWSGNTGI